MTAAPEYDLDTQSKITMALCVLHNFIRIHDPQDLVEEEIEEQYQELGRRAEHRTPEDYKTHITREESLRAGDKRDAIAKAMWEQYQLHLQRAE